MTTDVKHIALNTGYSEEDIKAIKDYVFYDNHDLEGEYRRFYSNYMMAQSWQRLISGKSIQPHDLTLLKHEKMERELVLQGYTQNEAHTITSQKYNYAKEATMYHDSIKKNRTK